MKKLMLVGAGRLGHEVAEWIDARTYEVFLADHAEKSFFHPDHVDGAIECAVPIAAPTSRRQVVERLHAAHPLRKFAILQHWSADLTTASIGHGSIFCQNSVASVRAQIGEHVIVNMAATIGHDVQIGSFTTISSHVDVCGRAVIGEGVFIGSSAVILPGIKIGKDAVIGAGAVVTSDVESGATVFGNPARRMK